MSICPKCEGKQYCPCTACSPKNKDKTTWVWVGSDGPIECGHCGHTMSVDEWETLDYKEYKGETR